MAFKDRTDAGRRLGQRLAHLRGTDPVVLGLPRGGIPVAYEVAEALGAPLDVIVVRKLGLPFQPELAMGAIAEGGVRIVNEEATRLARISPHEFAAVEARERVELDRRAKVFRGDRPRVPLDGRTVVVVDDGLATGSTASAACQVVRMQGAVRVVLAVPVAPLDTAAKLQQDADEVVCLEMPEWFFAIGAHYADFSQTPDGQVRELLDRAQAPTAQAPTAQAPTAQAPTAQPPEAATASASQASTIQPATSAAAATPPGRQPATAPSADGRSPGATATPAAQPPEVATTPAAATPAGQSSNAATGSPAEEAEGAEEAETATAVAAEETVTESAETVPDAAEGATENTESDENATEAVVAAQPPAVAAQPVSAVAAADPPEPRRRDVEIAADGVRLRGQLTIPEAAGGVVVFAHGSGSSRHSPRNRFVADVLNQAGLATLLFDLLTPAEEHDRANVFDIGLLAGRLLHATRWLRGEGPDEELAAGLPTGFFGASTGAAAALWAAAEPDADIAAVVSRGGRPDLASPKLAAVRAPTLLIVGGYDHLVLDLNAQAQATLRCESQLVVVPDATHLFAEPGTLEQAAAVARDWFADHLTPATRGGG